MAWAFGQRIDPPAKLVLLALADHANGQTGLCIPGQKLLAEQCSMSVRTVQRHLQTLEARGLIRRETRMRGQGRGRTSDRYYLGDQGDNPASTRQDATTNATNQDDQCDTAGVAEPEENRKKESTCGQAARDSNQKGRQPLRHPRQSVRHQRHPTHRL
jgi:DNA-binding MarR family transcriptional regulator